MQKPCKKPVPCVKRTSVKAIQVRFARSWKKGTDKVNEASHKRGRDDVVVAEGLRVHRDCRKWYTNERDIQTSLKRATEPSAPRRKSMRVNEGPFNFRTDCLFFDFVYCTRRCTCRTYGLHAHQLVDNVKCSHVATFSMMTITTTMTMLRWSRLQLAGLTERLCGTDRFPSDWWRPIYVITGKEQLN